MKILRKQQKSAVKQARGRCRAAPDTTFGGSLLALESRIMFDGAAAETVNTVTTEHIAQSQAEASFGVDDATTADNAPPAPTGEAPPTNGDQALFDALAAYDASVARQEIVFLSPSVLDYQKLLDGISPNVEVIVLDATRDGVEQMAEVLAGRTGIDAIHIISHGAQAELTLGTARLTLESMNGVYANELAVIGQSLSEKADLLIYGCNFGEGDLGQQAVGRLAERTGADVAASTDNTGHTDLGGDWHFEQRTGDVEAAVAISDGAMREWRGLLAETILESYEPSFASMGDQAYEVKSDQAWGQTFVNDSPGATYTVHRIGLVLYQDNAATPQAITVSLRSSWNGPVIASGQISSTSLGTTEAWVHIDLTTPATLTDNASYYIRVDSSLPSGKVYVGVDDAGLYASGDLINDGGAPETPKDLAFRVIEVTNAAPAIANLSGDSLAYNEGDGAVVIEQGGNATVTDVDSADFDSGTLIVSFATGSDAAEDVLAIRNQGAGAGQIGVSGNNVSYGGVTIGAFAGGSGGTNLVVTFNSNTTPAAAQALIRNITYQNTDTDNPTTGARTVRYVLTDGDGGSSGNHDTTITVNGLNDLPVITSNGGGATASSSVGENTAAVTTVISTDVDGGAAVYSIVPVGGGGAADAAKFTINSSTGALSFVTAPDFENPTDAGLNNVYDVTVQVSDGSGGTTTQVISVSVVNHPRVYDQFNTVSYGGNDGDQNWLNNWTEIGESNGTGSGVVRVSSSGYMRIGGDDVTITNRGASRAADLSGAGYAILSFDYRRVDIDGGGGSINLQVSSDGGSNWNTLTTYSLSSFDGSFVAASFDISAYATAGTQIRFLGSGGSTEAEFRVDNVAIEHNGTAGNSAPVITSNGGGGTASISVAENATAVTDVNATDPEAPPQTLTYSLSGDDAARFTIDSNTGVLTFASAPDFENPSDLDTDNVYEVTVQVSDGNGGTDTQALAVTVTDVNEAPTAVALNNQVPMIAENTVIGAGYKVADIGVTDDALGTNGLSLSGADAADFTIVGTELFYTGASPNFETKSSYAVTVNVNDATVGGTPDASVSFTLIVTDVNDAPVGVPTITGTVTEDQTLTASTGGISDADGLGAFSYQWLRNGVAVGGATASTYVLGDADVGAQMSMQVTYTDGQGTVEGPLTSAQTAAVANVNDAPVATNLNAAEVYALNTPLDLADIVISDVDSATVTATLTLSDLLAGSLSTGTSGSVTSTYNAATGVWTAVGAIADVNALLTGVTYTPALLYINNFTIATSVDDGVAPAVTGSKSMTSVLVNLPPIVTNLNAAETYTEDTPLDLTNIVVTDLDSVNVTATLTLSDLAAGSLSTGTSGSVTSTYNAATGIWTASGAIGDVNALLAVVTFTPAPNYNSNFTMTTSVDDGVAVPITGVKNMTGTPVNDAPTGTDATVTTVEDTALTFTMLDFGFTDVDVGGGLSAVRVDTLPGAGTLTLSGAAVTAGDVILVADITAGNLVFTPAPNASGAGYASVTFSVRDQASAFDPTPNTLTIDVTAVNDVPVNTVPGPQSVNEDTALALTGITVNDVDGNLSTVQLAVAKGTVTVSLAGGATISSGANGTATLTLSGTQADINTTLASLIYQGTLNYTGPDMLTLTSADTGSATDLGTVTITVNPVNDAPIITSDGGGATAVVNHAENQTVVTTVTKTDVDGGAATYSIVGGADAALFTLNATTGALTFNAGPNFEAPGDAGTNNVYDVTVQVTDGNGGADVQVFRIMVTDVNETVPPTTPPPAIPPSLVPPSPLPPNGSLPPAGSPPLPPILVGPPPSPLPNPEAAGAPVPLDNSSGGTTPSTTEAAGASAHGGGNIRVPSVLVMREPGAYFEEKVVTLIPQAVKEVAFDEHTLTKASAQLSAVFQKTLKVLEGDLRRDTDTAESNRRLIVRVTNMGGITLTAGLITWLLQSGSLLASLTATLPAWRHFDPLPVTLVGNRERRKRKAETAAAAEHENKQFRGLGSLLDKKGDRSDGGGTAT